MGVIKVAELVPNRCDGCVYSDAGIRDWPACRHPDGRRGSVCDSEKAIFIAAPAALARATDPTTSKGKRKVNKYEQAVLTHLEATGALGANGHQIAGATGHPLNCITPRFAPLCRKGLIKDSGDRQDRQTVWVLV